MAETPSQRKTRTQRIIGILAKAYPEAQCSLNFSNPLELLVAAVLSAQCTDVRVNMVTARLFKKYRTAQDYAKASLPALEQDLRQINFYRNKAKSIKSFCTDIVEKFGGKVPNRMEDLVTLHGVARKTANVVLGNAYGIQAGIVVDTHVMRLAGRLGLSQQTDRDKIEQDLIPLVPQTAWTRFAHLLISHGRLICKAPTPLCGQCQIGKALCPSYRATAAPKTTAPGHRC